MNLHVAARALICGHSALSDAKIENATLQRFELSTVSSENGG